MTTAIPMLVATPAADAIEFYKHAFGAVEVMRMADDDGKIAHAEINIGGARIMIADEYPQSDALSPQSVGGTPVMILLEVDDVDSFFQQAVDAGASVLRPIMAGDLRNGKLRDPFGHHWMILTHVKETSG